jgi:hypothetical protein
VPQRADFTSRNIDRAHVKEFDLGQRPAVQFFEDLRRIRTLDLKAVAGSNNGLSLGVRRRPVVFLDFDLVASGLPVKLNPIRHWSAPNEHQAVFFQMEQDAVADHVPAVAARRKLLGAVHRKIREAVRRKGRKHLERIGALDVDIRHVVGLVKENRGLAPSALLVAPIRIFGRDYRIDVRADLRIAQQRHRIPSGSKQILQTLLAHRNSPCAVPRTGGQFARGRYPIGIQHTERAQTLQDFRWTTTGRPLPNWKPESLLTGSAESAVERRSAFLVIEVDEFLEEAEKHLTFLRVQRPEQAAA